LTQENFEAVFDQVIEQIKPDLVPFSNYDLVIGIPFYNETENIGPLLLSIDRVLQSWMGKRQLLVLIGDHSSQACLEIINQTGLKHPHIEFLLPLQISGRGTAIRAIIEISKRLDADLLLFSANMANQNGPGIDNAWLESLLTPIQGNYDMVLGSMRKHLGIDSITQMMAAPILEAFYGFRVGNPMGGIYALSQNFIEQLAHEARFWGPAIQGSGIDFWILTRALCWNKNVCEVNMGGVVNPHDLATRNRIFAQTAEAVFESISRDIAVWMQDRLIIKVADILSYSEIKRPDTGIYSLPDLLSNFRNACQKYRGIIESCSQGAELLALSGDEDDFHLHDDLWVAMLFDLMQMYAFDKESDRKPIFELMTGIYNGRVASYMLEMQQIESQLGSLNGPVLGEILVGKMESIRRKLTNVFLSRKPELNRQWLQKKEQAKPPLVPLGYMEYVPGRPIVIPKKIIGKDRRIIATDNIFRNLRKRYEDKFNDFIYQGLGISKQSGPQEIVEAVGSYMGDIEKQLDRILPGDLSTYEGLESFIHALFSLLPETKMYTISDDKLREMLVRFPPINLMIPLGYYSAEQLVENMDTRDAVTLANMIEDWIYVDRDLSWLVDNLKPESFNYVNIKPLILTEKLGLGDVSRAKISSLNLMTGRIAVKKMERGQGGRYPKLRYFTALLRRLMMADSYSELFVSCTNERKNLGAHIRNALRRMNHGDEFSAHNIFENFNHRKMVEKLAYLSELYYSWGREDIGRIFSLMRDSYGLSQVLENSVFLTCTAWSWASYSFKGGLKIPTPITTSVESRWFNHDFLELLYNELGYEVEEILDITFRLIKDGKSHVNLLDTLMPTRPKDVMVVVQETTNEPSKYLQRHRGNPILEPIENTAWESKYVLNPGSLRIGDKVYLFYRGVGGDNISHIGLAITDGYQVIERLPEPILSPLTPEEKMGCEDPRLIIVEGKIYMLYTAYDGNIAQIAAASIGIDDFKSGNYRNWHREGLAFRNIWDKDAILFPEKINGKYVIYHRIEPSIWVTYMSELRFPIWEKHEIIIGPRPGRMWDSLKIGAGAQPLKTRYGWLLIYHGVDYNYVYRLGVILVDLNNPSKVIFRSPNPILEPEEDYEIGLSGAWVPNVVFTCGAVAGSDKEILDDGDEILVYYGAADTSIGMAKATLADLLPERFRQQ
jgi:predicted GH43/DUF377 family glycosyl hydrolase/glycosyltransferase involved in cell wall biosynthesis